MLRKLIVLFFYFNLIRISYVLIISLIKLFGKLSSKKDFILIFLYKFLELIFFYFIFSGYVRYCLMQFF
jgi:hypothetical protein